MEQSVVLFVLFAAIASSSCQRSVQNNVAE
jgi:hypothetical protein